MKSRWVVSAGIAAGLEASGAFVSEDASAATGEVTRLPLIESRCATSLEIANRPMGWLCCDDDLSDRARRRARYRATRNVPTLVPMKPSPDKIIASGIPRARSCSMSSSRSRTRPWKDCVLGLARMMSCADRTHDRSERKVVALVLSASCIPLLLYGINGVVNTLLMLY